MTQLFQDLRYAVRQLRRSPGFAASVVVVLALGIGANAAMFTILEATLFRPLPYTHSRELVRLNTTDNKGKPSWSRLSDVLVWQARNHTLSQIAYFDTNKVYLNSESSDHQATTQEIMAIDASPNLFSTLGVSPVLGRSFTADEQQPGRQHIAILSDTVWRTQFHADPAILGRIVQINDTPTTIIGVMAAGFLFPADESPAQIWTPAMLGADAFARTFNAPSYRLIARLAAGASITGAEAELSGIQKDLAPLYTDTMTVELAPKQVAVSDYRRSLSAADQRTALFALLGAVAVLWLIACANVASLMLARTAARRREMAVRSALGATRWRLSRQTLVESLLLSLSGGVLGLALSQVTLRIFRHSLTTQFSPNIVLQADIRVLLALTGLSVLSALLFGIVPSSLAAKVPAEQALRQDGAQAGRGRHQQRLQRILVVSELALTLTMLVSCGLLLRTVFALRKVPLGFRTEHVFVIDPHLPSYKYSKLDPNSLVYKPLLERISSIPGIQSAAITTVAPLDPTFNAMFQLYLGDGKKDKFSSKITSRLRASGPELQQVLGFKMLRGRYFNAQDTADSRPVAVVNRAFAQLYDPVGGDVSKFSIGDKERQFQIVGVIDDFHQAGIADPAEPELDMNAVQMRPSDGFYQPTLKAHAQIVLRSTRDPRNLIPEINHVLRQFNPDLGRADIRTMDQIVEDAMGSQLLAAHLLETLGGLALVVALAGLYSLLAYLVTLRTRELGLRLALGAQRSDISTLVLRNAGTLLVSGVVAGIGVSLLVTRLLTHFLFGVKAHDLLTLIAAPTLLLLVGLIAAWLPARRAAALEPMQALRTE